MAVAVRAYVRSRRTARQARQQALHQLQGLVPEATRYEWKQTLEDLPEGFWSRLHYLWERPVVKSVRITMSVANWGVRIPAIAALILTQGGLIVSQVRFQQG